jgi:CubicO group peptidase (beta-lactamase class C family)
VIGRARSTCRFDPTPGVSRWPPSTSGLRHQLGGPIGTELPQVSFSWRLQAVWLALLITATEVYQAGGRATSAGNELPIASPADVGLDPTPLQTLRSSIVAGRFPRTTSMLVVKDGRLVVEEYFEGGGRDVLNDTRSATKSVTSLAIGAALADGKLNSVAQPAFALLRDLGPFAHDGPLKQGITIEDLLTMSSALDCNDWDDSSPGNEENMYPRQQWVRWAVDLPTKAHYTRDTSGRGDFSYCTAGTLLLGQIVQRATGESVDQYIEKRLLEPLGIRKVEWPHSPSGEVMTGGGLRLRSRDLAKLGLLVLDRGQWQGKRVLPKQWFQQSLTARRHVDAVQDYGYLFWRREYRTPSGHVSGWYMSGNGGNAIVIVPEQHLVAVVTRVHYNSRSMHQQTVALLEEHVFAGLRSGRSRPTGP